MKNATAKMKADFAVLCREKSKVKHTPGPWVVKGMNHNLVYAPDGWIADVRAGTRASAHSEEASTNANLIAAAPDLLAACKDCLEGRGDWMALMTAAIAKAEGRS